MDQGYNLMEARARQTDPVQEAWRWSGRPWRSGRRRRSGRQGDLGGFVLTRRRQQGDLGVRGQTLTSQAKSSQVKPSHGQVKVSTVAGLWCVKQEQPEEKSGGPRTRAGYQQQELVRSRKAIKWSTPTTRMDTVQPRQVQDRKMERKSLQGQKNIYLFISLCANKMEHSMTDVVKWHRSIKILERYSFYMFNDLPMSVNAIIFYLKFVINLPKQNSIDFRPHIVGENPSGYRVQDWLDVNCTSPKSFPPALLKWYINNEMVSSWSKSNTIFNLRKVLKISPKELK